MTEILNITGKELHTALIDNGWTPDLGGANGGERTFKLHGVYGAYKHKNLLGDRIYIYMSEGKFGHYSPKHSGKGWKMGQLSKLFETLKEIRIAR